MSETLLETRASRCASEAGHPVLDGPGNRLSDHDPSWFAERRSRAWELFESLPMPARTDEPWRFSNFKALELSRFRVSDPLPGPVEAELVARSRSRFDVTVRAVFANERLAVLDPVPAPLSEAGLVVLPFAEALERMPGLLREKFMTQEAVLGSAKFAALHAAWVRSGTVIYVPPGLQVGAPVEIYHWVAGEGSAIFPHTLIVLGENSRLSVLEHLASADDGESFSAGVTDLHLGEGSKLTYALAQEFSRRSVSVHVQSTMLSKDSSAMTLGVHLGGRYSRSENLSRMVGEGARSDMLAVTLADGEQDFDQRTLQDHLRPNTTSDLLYKNALDGKSRTIFSGLIKVEKSAHFTDAYQKVRNLLMSDEAEANSMPGLEINADQVRCTHGATSGQIEPEEMFYLLSRGIRQQEARKLIVLGFLQEVVDRLGDQALADHLGELVTRRFRQPA